VSVRLESLHFLPKRARGAARLAGASLKGQKKEKRSNK
jgi:hypothetical protein